MDAKAWRKCKVAKKLVDEAVGHVSERQLRLLACALARLRWHKMEPDARVGVLAVESYLDGVRGAKKPSSRARIGSGPGGPGLLALACKLHDAKAAATIALASLRVSKETLLRLIRCLFGNPFEPLRIEPAWLSANDRAVLRLTQAIATTGDHSRMPILADALVDVGCSHSDLLDHLCADEKHHNNCWALEAILAAAGDAPPRLLPPEPQRPNHPDQVRALQTAALPCPRCRQPGPRTIHLLTPPKADRERVFIRCVPCEHVVWVTKDGLANAGELTLRALEVVAATCPECGGSRKAFRSRSGENAGRAFLKCTDPECNSFEWADAGTRDMPKVAVFHED